MNTNRLIFKAVNHDKKVIDVFNYLYWFEEQGVMDPNNSEWEIFTFTGLKDNKGNMIFDDDRLTMKNNHLTGTVFYDERECMFNIKIDRLDGLTETMQLSYFCRFGVTLVNTQQKNYETYTYIETII